MNLRQIVNGDWNERIQLTASTPYSLTSHKGWKKPQLHINAWNAKKKMFVSKWHCFPDDVVIQTQFSIKLKWCFEMKPDAYMKKQTPKLI